MAHSEPTHVEHTGHGGHHVISKKVLLTTFGGLVALTIITVVLGLMEREGIIHVGPLSVPMALAIASVKAFLVAAFFMGLKYDGGTNLLAFLSGGIFLSIFLAFTYLDTGFRDTFEDASAVPVDIQNSQVLEAEARSRALQPAFEAAPLVETPDRGLFPNAAGTAADGSTALDSTLTDPAPTVEADAGEIESPSE